MGSLDISNLSHSSCLQHCSWRLVECAVLTLTSGMKTAEGEDLSAQHPEAGSELGLCLQSSDSSMAMKQLK